MPNTALVALAAGCLAAAAACAHGMAPPAGPIVSPTGIIYERGTPPTSTRHSQTASLYLRSEQPDRTLELAREGITHDPSNPVHWYLAGLALLDLGQYPEADSMLATAQRIYPAHELDIEPARQAAWADSFNRGARAFRGGDTATAMRAWDDAATVFDLRPDAHQNLATVHYGAGRYDAAIDLYRRALAGLGRVPATRVLDEPTLRRRAEERERIEDRLVALLLATGRGDEAEPILRGRLDANPVDVSVRQRLAAALATAGRDVEARDLYAGMLGDEGLDGAVLFGVGVALFQLEDYAGAATAFRRLVALRPHSRDAWFNYANSLFAAGDWAALMPAGDRLVELDPLNESAALIAARAHLEMGDDEAARDRLARIEEAPVYLDALVARVTAAGTVLQGRVVGHRALPGRVIRLRFVFYGDTEELGAETVWIAAPAPGESRAFDLSFPRPATSYRYELEP